MTYAKKGSNNHVVCLSVKFLFDLATFVNSGDVQVSDNPELIMANFVFLVKLFFQVLGVREQRK